MEGNPDGDATAELEKRLHMLVQRGLDVPPVAPPRRGTKAKVSIPVDDLPQQPADHPQQPDDSSQQTQGISQHSVDHLQQLQPALEQEPLEFWNQDDIDPWVVDATVNDSQQQLEVPEYEHSNSWHYSQQPGHEWLDLSQASFILDENGRPIAFEDLDHEEYSYQLVPLEDD
jgi:hypothetical protein